MADPLFHAFPAGTSLASLPSLFTFPFCYRPHPLCVQAAALVQSFFRSQPLWQKDISAGKMFGVLVAQAADGSVGFLSAFSGQLAGRECWPFFVPPVFSYLQPQGYFKTHERQISLLNRQIEALSSSSAFREAQMALDTFSADADARLSAAKAELAQAKSRRDALRGSAALSPEQAQALTRESQFQKAEFHRLKLSLAAQSQTLQFKVQSFSNRLAQLKSQRENQSLSLQMWLFNHTQVSNALGQSASLPQLFVSAPQGVPPSGAGECCAPKLLQYAFSHHLHPLAMAEFWWGRSPKGEVRSQGLFYPACQSKCQPILRFMLQGLAVEPNPLQVQAAEPLPIKVVFEDDFLMVIDKPSGLLSVPGKLEADSVYAQVLRLRPSISGPVIVHRLDMATSGLMLVAKNKEVHHQLQSLFHAHAIHKQYTAVLQGALTSFPPSIPVAVKSVFGREVSVGVVTLPLCPDVSDRPRQMVHAQYGKPSVTYVQILAVRNHQTLVYFYPQTGRTHQLRVHSSHVLGLGLPIVGDALYGLPSHRLLLDASAISFVHPVTHQPVTFSRPAAFLWPGV